MIIKKLSWDSDFFGLKIGKLELSEDVLFSIDQFKSLSEPYDLIYIFSKKKINYSLIKLVDTKVIYKKQVFRFNEVSNNLISINEFNHENQSISVLENLALSSGIYSRFKLDENFRDTDYTRLYKQWIHNAIDDNKQNVYIATYNDKSNPIGFVSTLSVNENDLVISLIAVDNEARGLGVASSLISKVEKTCLEKNLSYIIVATQKINVPANKLYEKNNFKLVDSTYIYHYWNI